ncbi:MAG: methyltransferase domain-containing protein [bacterium]
MIYYAEVVRGLEKVALSELEAKLDGLRNFSISPGKLRFLYDGDPRFLAELRSPEKVYILIGKINGVDRSRKSLGKIYRWIVKADLNPALSVHRKLCGSGGKRVPTFKVEAHLAGRRNYRRVDLDISARNAISVKYPKWRWDPGKPNLEFRIDAVGEEAEFGLRLPAREDYKSAHIPASLPPTVAYCMVALSRPEPEDVFLDPMCGTGTILIERALFGRYKKIIGGDIDPVAKDAAEANIGPRHQPREMHLWDARDLPLPDGSVDKVVCNPPFGRRIGTHSENRELYPRFLSEVARVLRAGGCAVILTSERDLMAELIEEYEDKLRCEDTIKIELLGVEAYIFVLNRV